MATAKVEMTYTIRFRDEKSAINWVAARPPMVRDAVSVSAPYAENPAPVRHATVAVDVKIVKTLSVQ